MHESPEVLAARLDVLFWSAIMPANRSRAFTLIELLVVISIIALLISILLPSLSAARQSAEITVCLSNQRQMTMAVIQYADQCNEYLPIVRYNADLPQFKEFGLGRQVGPMNRLGALDLIPSVDSANPYGSAGIRLCPTLAPLHPSSSISSDFGGLQALAHHVMPYELTGYTHVVNGTSKPHRRTADIKSASSVYLLAESEYYPGNNTVGLGFLQDDPNLRWRAGAEYIQSASGWTTSGQVERYRHMVDRTNFSFADGHGDTRSWDTLTNSFGPIHYVDN